MRSPSLGLLFGMCYRVLLFVDHSGVHAACVSGTSKDPVWRSLLIELECAMMGWIARVPSPSNPADAPSKPPAQIVFLFGWGNFHFGLPKSEDVGRCHGRWRGCYSSAGL